MAEALDATLTADTADLTTASALWWKRPDAKDDAAATNEDDLATVNVLANDVGALGIVKINGTSVTVDTPPVPLTSGATVDLDGRTLIYHPGEAFLGLDSGESKVDTFSYTVSGRGKGTDTANVMVTVNGVNDGEPGGNHAPVAADDKAYLPDFYPYPMPYEQADSTDLTVAPIDEGPIMTTLAIGEEGDPYPYLNDVTINVLANDTDADGDHLAISTIDGKPVASGEAVKLHSGATVALKNGSLFYDGADDVVIDPVPLAEPDVAASSDATSELVSIPYPADFLVDSFTYSVSDNALSDDATVNIYRMSGYVLDTESAV